MPNINIYVSDELKDRMDRAGGPKWSAVAQQAFELELAHIEARKETDMLSRTIERLRASKAENAMITENDGRTSGRSWAAEVAEYAELKRAAAFSAETRSGSPLDAEYTYQKICGTDERPTTDEMALLFYGDEDMAEFELSDDFLTGFLKGAAEVWEEVADKI
ncbi:MAG: hypothetical protein AAF495_10760 [Pseudomonadota bacterium]